jgi:hypothetical protein
MVAQTLADFPVHFSQQDLKGLFSRRPETSSKSRAPLFVSGSATLESCQIREYIF